MTTAAAAEPSSGCTPRRRSANESRASASASSRRCMRTYARGGERRGGEGVEAAVVEIEIAGRSTPRARSRSISPTRRNFAVGADRCAYGTTSRAERRGVAAAAARAARDRRRSRSTTRRSSQRRSARTRSHPATASAGDRQRRERHEPRGIAEERQRQLRRAAPVRWRSRSRRASSASQPAAAARVAVLRKPQRRCRRCASAITTMPM